MSSAAIIPDQGLDVVQHPSLGTLKFPKDMPPDERNMSIIRLMAQQPKQSKNSDYMANILQDATISAPESGVAAFLDRVLGRVKTALSGGGRPEAAVDVVGGGALGPIRALKGIAQLPEHPIRGANNIIGGVGQTAALPLAVVNPSTMAVAAPSLIAQQGVTKALQAGQVDPDVTELLGNLAGIGVGAKTFKGMQPKPAVTPTPSSQSIAPLLARELTGRVPLLGRLEQFKKPSISDYLDALRKPGSRPASQPESNLPNATYLRDDMRSLSQQPPVKQMTALDRANELLKGIKEHEFLSKVQDELNLPEGQPDVAAEIDARMAELAKKPFDVGGSVKPKYAYRVRDTGETGVMPRGHAQATIDLGEANSYMEGRGSAQAAPQEIVRVDLSKLNPSEYEMIPGPNGKQWVRFKGAVPESFISKVPPARLQKLQQMLAQPKPQGLMTEGSDLIKALQQMARAKGAD